MAKDPKRVAAAKKAAQTTRERYGDEFMSGRGKAGYEAATSTTMFFHNLGGMATAKLDGYTDPRTGATGLGALIEAGYEPKKKHRYRTGCKCCNR